MDVKATSDRLVAHFRNVHAERMTGLPILNPVLEVCAVDFQEFDAHALGVLITPWFINLVLLPGTAEWADYAQGSVARVTFPGSKIDFNVSHNDDLGTHLSAALFSSVADFPDQDTAVAVAREILRRLFEPAEEASSTSSISRRDLFTRLGTG